jgi:CubicO group peptidase (beta-lactamase class C family)
MHGRAHGEPHDAEGRTRWPPEPAPSGAAGARVCVVPWGWRVTGALVATAVAVALLPAAASGAVRCAPPQGAGPGAWERATPAEAGMDGARLQAALDYGTANLGFALRVYRRGCLVGRDRLAPVNQSQRFESWSMAKSATAILFARAMTLGLISPGDPVGSLVGRASQAHGRITAHDLLTMTSGLRWNGWRDYNIFTMPDRVRDALTLEQVHEPGAYYEYAQSAVSLLVEAVRRASGEDPVDFMQGRVFDRIGIPRSAWDWERDRQGQVLGFMGVEMRPDDFGRLGELMRRGGQWRGQRILSPRVVRRALQPSATNGCYGWLIWVNRSGPCIGPTITDRPESARRQFPGLPADMYRFSGLLRPVGHGVPQPGPGGGAHRPGHALQLQRGRGLGARALRPRVAFDHRRAG